MGDRPANYRCSRRDAELLIRALLLLMIFFSMGAGTRLRLFFSLGYSVFCGGFYALVSECRFVEESLDEREKSYADCSFYVIGS